MQRSLPSLGVGYVCIYIMYNKGLSYLGNPRIAMVGRMVDTKNTEK